MVRRIGPLLQSLPVNFARGTANPPLSKPAINSGFGPANLPLSKACLRISAGVRRIRRCPKPAINSGFGPVNPSCPSPPVLFFSHD
ncbi:hypothetical protein PSAB_22025 [Paenibacillus sabinae T27]|uniref:Uncharacterized protein n=1 Tax=Paenibacillus sabinae T27 TaxID=1268072 RepID=X5A684_9BACL|nr:hypothetical protein PSAB_22025 [Paenibacillus sabinae T27]